MKWIKMMVCLLVWGSVAHAEFRIWEGINGDVFEGEFVTLAGEFVVIKDQVGKEYRMKPDELCAADLKYLEWCIPPALNLDVSKSTDSSQGSSQSESVSCIATIKQVDRRPYTGQLTAVLVVMGESVATGTPMLVNRKEFEFTLPEVRGQTVQIRSERASFSRKARKAGREYSGYILVVYDRFGEAIATKTNRSAYEERATSYASLGVDKKLKKKGAGFGR